MIPALVNIHFNIRLLTVSSTFLTKSVTHSMMKVSSSTILFIYVASLKATLWQYTNCHYVMCLHPLAVVVGYTSRVNSLFCCCMYTSFQCIPISLYLPFLLYLACLFSVLCSQKSSMKFHSFQTFCFPFLCERPNSQTTPNFIKRLCVLRLAYIGGIEQYAYNMPLLVMF